MRLCTLRQKVNILSIDGGGVRAIVPAMVLEGLASVLAEQGKTLPLYRYFHLMAGTSAGALLTLGLSMPKAESGHPAKKQALFTPKELVNLIRYRCTDIFPLNRQTPTSYLAQTVRRKYGDNSVNTFLKEMLGDTRLQEALTNILVTSYNTEAREPFYFKKRPPVLKWKDDPDFYSRDAARATIAAPTFFSPAHIEPLGGKKGKLSLIDGGIFVNNPALTAYIEARKIYPHAREFNILSLGTGHVDKPYYYETVKNWGFLNWMIETPTPPLFDMMVDGQSDSVDYMLRKLPGVNFHRLDFHLDVRHSGMDDVRPFNLDYLQAIGSALIEERQKDLAAFCRIL